MDIYDSDGSVRHDMSTATEDITRHLEEYAQDPGAEEVAEAEGDAVNETSKTDELEEHDNPFGFIMDWGPF